MHNYNLRLLYSIFTLLAATTVYMVEDTIFILSYKTIVELIAIDLCVCVCRRIVSQVHRNHPISCKK